MKHGLKLSEVAVEVEASGVLDGRCASKGLSTNGSAVTHPESESMRAVNETIDCAAASRVNILLLGETGVGKEVAARRIHERSDRRRGPLVNVNCGSVPEHLLYSTLFGHQKGAFTGANSQQAGIFEAANHGTVFLDEVGELRTDAQVALLRVLETNQIIRLGSNRPTEVDVRVIAATHRDLEKMVRVGSFRQDLFFRLDVVQICIPPLRERLEEIPALVRCFIDQANHRHARSVSGMRPETMLLLQTYNWPGNIRELRNVIERAVALTKRDVLGDEDLPLRFHAPEARRKQEQPPHHGDALLHPSSEQSSLRALLEQYEARLLVAALERAGGNQTQAAKLLGLPRRTLIYKLRRLRLAARTRCR